MTELLAVLTVAYVVYVLYEVFKSVSNSGGSQPLPAAASESVAVSEAAVAVAEEIREPEIASAPAKAATASSEKPPVLRNPVTGETSPLPSNYRFAKKWIKEALVSEGLLKKVYKNSELTEAVNPIVKEALEQFKLLEQYHGK